MPDALSETSACSLQRRWKSVLGMVEIQLGNQADFNAYLANTQATSVADGVLHVTVKNGFIAAWIRQRVMRSLRRFTAQVFGQEIKIELETMAYTSSDVLVREGLAGDYTQWRDVRMRQQRANMARENALAFPTIPSSTFERFESSDCNAQAMSASEKVVENPGTEFNPLTITAETGQGKTHLLNAIANQMRQNDLNVVCLTGEEFVDNYVKSSRAGNVDLVRDRYRGVDALLVDGIEKLIGKEKTQSFFLNIVEHLISNQKQLVFTFNSSYPMLDLGEEITSRLSGGLEIAIEPPDFKLKRSLLHRYANERHLDLAAEALDYLSNRVARNVREIIGGIARVDAHLRFSNPAQSATLPSQAAAVSTVNLAVAIDAVRDRVSAPEPTMMAPEAILDAVAGVFKIDVDELCRTGRGNRSVNAARDLAIYMLREKCGLTSSETGNLIGGRPHSTVLAALARYSERRQSDPQLGEAERRVERMLRQPS